MNSWISLIGKHGKGFADITRLNNQIGENRNRIKILYEEIGEIYYQLHANDAEPQMRAQIASIKDMQKQNQQWEEQILDLRGFQKCPHCGQIVKKNMAFCDKCGNRILAEHLIVCKKCGMILEKGTMFCINCGERVSHGMPTGPAVPRTCNSCGSELPAEVSFCPKCGSRVQEAMVQQVEELPNSEAPESSVKEVHTPNVCPVCHAALEGDEMFCSNCGERTR